MSAIVNILFGEWLIAQLDDRKMTQADLAREAGVSRAAVSDVISGRRQVGTELATSIAKAFKLPVEQVYRAAGLLPPAPDLNEEAEQIMHEVAKLSKSDQEEVLAFIRMKNNLRKKK